MKTRQSLAFLIATLIASGCGEDISPDGSRWFFEEPGGETDRSEAGEDECQRGRSCEPNRPVEEEPDRSDLERLRGIFPPDRSMVGTSTPDFRWTGDENAEYLLEVCVDRYCSEVAASQRARGLSAKLETSLEPGLYFWSVSPSNSRLGSERRIFVVASSDAPDAPTHWGGVEDLDRDGLADVVATVWRDEPRIGMAFGRAGLPLRTIQETAAPSPGFPAAISALAVSNFDNGSNGSVLAALTDENDIGPQRVAVIPSYIRGSYTVDIEARWSIDTTKLSYVGDVNLDGYDDLALGAPDEDAIGAVYLVYGEWDRMGERITRLVPTEERWAESRFGKALAGPFDANADGYSDFVIAAEESPRGPGLVYVALGGPDGVELQEPYTTGSSEADAVVDLDVGDFDGDGYPDFVAALRSDCPIFYRNQEGRGFVSEKLCDDRPLEQLHSVALLELDGSPAEELVGVFSSGDVVRWDYGSRRPVILESVGVTNGCLIEIESPGDFDGDGLDDLLIEQRSCAGEGVALELLTASGLVPLTPFTEPSDRR